MVSNQNAVCCTSQIGVGTSEEPVVWADTGNPSWVYAPPNTGELPDLDHTGTRAFLLEDVRRALGFNAPYHEAEALIAALEAAPE